MPVFLCRWPNGDVSIVAARNKDDAIVILDEFANADEADIYQLKEFLVDFRLANDGSLELSQFGGGTYDEIMKKAFPELDKTFMSDELHGLNEHSQAYKSAIRTAVASERKRLWGKKKNLKEAKTELGKRLQKELGAAAVIVDRAIEKEEAERTLRNLKTKKPTQ